MTINNPVEALANINKKILSAATDIKDVTLLETEIEKMERKKENFAAALKEATEILKLVKELMTPKGEDKHYAEVFRQANSRVKELKTAINNIESAQKSIKAAIKSNNKTSELLSA